MQFANYAAFRTAMQQMVDGDDISQSDLSVAVLDLMIAAGERRIYREIRSSTMDVALSVTATNNIAPLPADYLELRGAPYVAPNKVARYMPWEEIQNRIQVGACSGDHPVWYSFQGDNLIFCPSQSGTITGQYYKQFPDIVNGLNVLFTRHPDVFLYAALAESAPFLGEMERLPVWQQKYTDLLNAANEEERRRVTRGGKLQTRTR